MKCFIYFFIEWEYNRVICNKCKNRVFTWYLKSELYANGSGTKNLIKHMEECEKIQQFIQEERRKYFASQQLYKAATSMNFNDISQNINVIGSEILPIEEETSNNVGKKRRVSHSAQVQTVLYQSDNGGVLSKSTTRTPERDRMEVDLLFLRGQLPFSFIQSVAFTGFMKYIAPDCDLKSSSTLSRDILNVIYPILENSIKKILYDEMNNGTLFNIGTDIWNCGNQHRS